MPVRTRFLPLAGLVGAMFCLGGCTYVVEQKNPGRTAAMTGARGNATTVSDADTGKTIRLHVGDKFVVRLESNMTTGYGWRTKERKGNSLALDGKQPEYVSDPAPAGVVGSGGHSFFRFKAKRPGTETLRFVYVRPVAPDKVAKEVRFKVVVQ